MRTITLLVVSIVVLGGLVAAPAVATQSAATAGASPCETAPEYPLEVTDATGEPISLDESPETVVALQPSDAQTVFEIGAEDRLVGFPDSPATAGLDREERADIGDGYELDHEQIIELDPDVVLAANVTFGDDIETLRGAGLAVYQFETANSLEDVRENVLVTGLVTDECDGATDSADWMDDRLAVVEETVAAADDRPLAYYEMGEGETAGANSFQDALLTTAGFENLAAEAGIDEWGQLNVETILEADPDWIVHPDTADRPAVADAATSTTAYQDEQFVPVDNDDVNQPAPRVVLPLETIVATVYPDAYDRAVEEVADGERPDEIVPASTGNDHTNDADGDNAGGADDADGVDADDAIPGLGAVTAIVATLIACLLVRTRR